MEISPQTTRSSNGKDRGGEQATDIVRHNIALVLLLTSLIGFPHSKFRSDIICIVKSLGSLCFRSIHNEQLDPMRCRRGPIDLCLVIYRKRGS